jgi:hypothetical protein
MEAANPSEASVAITSVCDITFQKAGMFNNTAVKMSNHIFFKDVVRVCMYCLSPVHSVM